MYNVNFLVVVILLSIFCTSCSYHSHSSSIVLRDRSGFARRGYVSNFALSRLGTASLYATSDDGVAAVATPVSTDSIGESTKSAIPGQQQGKAYSPQRSFNSNNNNNNNNYVNSNSNTFNKPQPRSGESGPRVYRPNTNPQGGSSNGSYSNQNSANSNNGQRRQYNPRGAPSVGGNNNNYNNGQQQRAYGNQNNFQNNGGYRGPDKAAFLEFPQLLVRFK